MDPTTLKLFRELDALRQAACLSISDVAECCRVTPRTYKQWRAGGVPSARREADLHITVMAINNLLATGELPLHGRSPIACARRHRLLMDAMFEANAEEAANV